MNTIRTGFSIEELDPAMVEVLRNKSVAERLAIGFGMWRYARDTLRRVIATEHPEWSRVEIERETARRLLHGTR